jgi:hypothetical protein
MRRPFSVDYPGSRLSKEPVVAEQGVLDGCA